MSHNPNNEKRTPVSPLEKLNNEKLYFWYAVLSGVIFLILVLVGAVAWNSGIIPK